MFDRVLIVGYGSIGKRHLKLARKFFPNSEIIVLRHQKCSDVPDQANGCMSSVDQAIAFAPQMAVIANPSTFHISIAKPLAQKGTHLLIEKPLAAVPNGVEELIKTCRDNSTVLMVAYNLRFLPSLQRFRDLLHIGVIGKVLSVRSEIGQYLPSWRPGTDYRNSVSARKDLGGGVLLELSHELDYLRWIFGSVEWVQATVHQLSSLDIDVEDTVHLTLGFKADHMGNQLVANLNMDFIRHDTTRICTAIGEKGSLRWNGLTGLVELYRDGEVEWKQLFSHQQQRDDSYLAEWKHFLSCVQNRKKASVTGEDGLAVLRIIEAARESSASGCVAKVA